MSNNEKVDNDSPTKSEIEKIRAILSIQFDATVAQMLLKNKITIKRSLRTGRIKFIYLNGQLLGTLRATDERFIPTLYGAKLIKKYLPENKLTIKVTEGAAPWIAKGRTVFCKHIVDADEEILPGEEVFIVDTQGNLIALGKAILSGREMSEKKKGRAVKVRKGIGTD